jgi:hypothetical protein
VANKIVLFLVDGYTDRITLALPFGRFLRQYANLGIDFYVFQGDMTTRSQRNEQTLKATVGNSIKAYLQESKLEKRDIAMVVHVIDMDAVYLEENHIFETNGLPAHYHQNRYYSRNKEAIITRNHHKRRNIAELRNDASLFGLPYRCYYFSVHIEHALHNVINPTKMDKVQLAEAFEDRYLNDPEGLYQLFTSQELLLGDSYEASWAAIETEKSALRRASNLGLFLTAIRLFQPSKINSSSPK